MHKTRKVPKYTVYDNRTDECICVCESANRCAEIMGVTVNTFHHAINKTRGNRWTVVKEGYCEELSLPVPTQPLRLSLGQNIKKHRKSQGYTQTELSKITGISRVSLTRYENDKVAPNIWQLVTIADCLDTTIDTLVKGV